VVAIGAAIQAGVLAGDVKDVVLLDVTPLSLGLETLGGVMTALIERNTTIPTKKQETFTTAADNQTQVEIHIVQGERPMAKDNRSLGRFNLVGIPPAPRGMPQVDVAFDIDANGILHVSATDKATNKEQKITITASSGLSKDEVDNMVKEAESHAGEDKSRKELIEVRNQLDSLIYSTEKLVNENREKLPADDVKAIEDAIAEGKKALEQDNVEELKKAMENITQASHKVAEVLYKQTPPEGGAPGEAAGGAGEGAKEPEGDVVDAEVVEEEEKSSA
jgi:molecular chaperone DnaK